MSAPAQPRVPAGQEGGGQFASLTYGRPALPVQRAAAAPVVPAAPELRPDQVERVSPDGVRYVLTRWESIALDVVASCCAGCVYGNPA